MALNQDMAGNEIQIAHIQFKRKLSETQKSEQIRKLRTTIVEEKTSSVKTITSIANMMIGSSVILYPVLFIQDGLLSSLMMMLIVGLVQYWTCAILCLHSKPSEMDVNDTILRILGPKWYKANLTTNVLLLYIVCVVYFLLIGANFYDLTSSFFVWVNPDYTPPSSSDINFKVYSSQWAGIIVMLIIYPLLFVKKIEKLLGFLKLTAYGVMAYMGFVGAMAIKNMITGIEWGDYILFSTNFSNVAGAFALSFIVHPVISPILKKNLHQEKNNRDLFLGYVATAMIYAFVGIFGAFACGKDIKNAIDLKYSTIFQCFPRSEQSGTYIISKCIQLCILIQNMSAFPIISFLTRKQFLQIFSKNHPSSRLSLLFTLSLILVSLLVQVFSLNVAAVVSFDGAVIGFVLAYLIPVYMHLKCMYHTYTPEENDTRRALLEKNLQQQESQELVVGVSLLDDEELQCVEHPPRNKRKDRVLYSVIMTFGVAMGIFKIISFVTG